MSFTEQEMSALTEQIDKLTIKKMDEKWDENVQSFIMEQQRKELEDLSNQQQRQIREYETESWTERKWEEPTRLEKFADDYDISPPYLKEFGEKALDFMEFVFKNEKDTINIKPIRTVSLETFVEVLPYLATSIMIEKLGMPDVVKNKSAFIKKNEKYTRRILIPGAHTLGLDAKYIDYCFSEYLKTFLR